MSTSLDNLDREILKELETDSRLTPTNISRRLNIPRTTIKFRIDRMVESGIIRGFTLSKNFNALGFPTTAFILISFDSSRGVTQHQVATALQKISNVEEVHIISGEYDLLVKIRGKSIEDIGGDVVDRMHTIKGVARTLTLASFKESSE